MPSVNRVRWAKFRVTVLSVAACAILLTLVFLLTGGTLLEQKANIFLYVPDATGLDKDSPVRVDGIDVGKVKTVELTRQNDPNREVRVTMEVERERLNSITADSFAEISSDSLIGDKYVDITSQKSTAPIAPNGEIHLKPPSTVMKSVDLPQFEAQLRTISALITDIEEGRGQVGQFVAGNEVYSDINKSIGKIASAFHTAVTSTEAVDALYTDKLYKQVMTPLQNLDQSLARMQSGQGTAGQLIADSAQYDSAVKQVRDMATNLASIRSGVWLQSDEAYKSWNQTVVSFIQQVDRMNADPLLNSTALYENLVGSTGEVRDTLKDLRENPRKYLRLKVF
jgi:phospholipid/cholesterol/gamma-HCH transport system substrate-binding protein